MATIADRPKNGHNFKEILIPTNEFDFMERRRIANLLERYLRGESYSSIAGGMSIARSTVQSYVEKWKRGELDEYSEARPYVEEILEISKYLKSNKLDISHLREPMLNHMVLTGLGIDPEDMVKAVDVLKTMDRDIIGIVVSTVKKMRERNIDYSRLASDADDLQARIDRARSELADLTGREEDTRGRISDLEKEEGARKREVENVRGEIAKARAEMKKIETRISTDRERIEAAESILDRARSLGVDTERLSGFMDQAIRAGYDAAGIGRASALMENIAKRNLTIEDVERINESLEAMETVGLDINGIKELAGLVPHDPENKDNILQFARQFFQQRSDLTDMIGKDTEKKRELENEIKDLEEIMEKTKAVINTLIDTERKHEASYSEEIRSRELKIEELRNQMRDIEDRIWKKSRSMELADGLIGLIAGTDRDDVKNAITGIVEILREKGSNPLSASDREKIRDRLVPLFLDEFKDGIGILGNSKMRFIPKHDYDFFLRYRDKLHNLSGEVRRLEDLRTAYGKNISQMIGDALSGGSSMDAETSDLVRGIMHDVLREKCNNIFNLEWRILTMGHEELFLVGIPAESIDYNVGVIRIDEFVRAVRSGSDYVISTRRDGMEIRTSTCDALKQAFTQLMDTNEIERFRVAWRQISGISRVTSLYGGLAGRGRDEDRTSESQGS